MTKDERRLIRGTVGNLVAVNAQDTDHLRLHDRGPLESRKRGSARKGLPLYVGVATRLSAASPGSGPVKESSASRPATRIGYALAASLPSGT